MFSDLSDSHSVLNFCSIHCLTLHWLYGRELKIQENRTIFVHVKIMWHASDCWAYWIFTLQVTDFFSHSLPHFVTISLLLVARMSRLSGPFWLFAQNFWEVTGTEKWWFYLKMKVPWVVWTLSPWLLLKRTSELFPLSISREAKAFNGARALALTATYWNFHYLIFTARKQSCGKVVSVILFTGGGLVSQHALQVSRPTSRGEVEGFGLGGSPGTHQGVSQHALRQTPPSRLLLLRAVRILLECILVVNIYLHLNERPFGILRYE